MEDKSIYNEYFNYTQEYKKQYGDNVIVLLQVGAFFEIYGIKNIDTGNIEGSKIVEICSICELNMPVKAQTYKGGNIAMAGFRDYSLDKYIVKLTENGYTVPVFVQVKNGKKVSRILDKVYSIGTYISCDTDSNLKISNNIMSIWFETYKSRTNTQGTLVYGVSVINIFTGKSSIFQYETTYYMNVTTFDELERYISMYAPSEIILISPFDDYIVNQIMQYSSIQSDITHVIDSRIDNEKLKRCTSQKYLKEILSFFYKEDTYDICKEFHEHTLATQSFCYLLNFIQEHNPNLNKKICIPEFNNTSNRVILPNHTLIQLNIINDLSVDSKKMGKLSSILSFLNKCCSPMGRRLFQYTLTNPTFNEKWLQQEYDMIEELLKPNNYYMIEPIRKELPKLRDIDKICRQLVLKKLYPSSISHLYSSLDNIQQINTCLYENKAITKYLCSDTEDKTNDIDFSSQLDKKIKDIMGFLNEHFKIDKCISCNSMTVFNENIIQQCVSSELDSVVEKYELNQSSFHEIYDTLNRIGNYNFFKIHETEKSGATIQITNNRAEQIKSTIKDKNIEVQIGDSSFKLSEIKFVKASSSNMEISFPLLTKVCKSIIIYKNTLNELITTTYLQVLNKLEDTFFTQLEEISSYVARLDVLQSKAYIAKKYNYCKPTIDSDLIKSGFKATDMRHCLIEQIQQEELYVPNDVTIGIDSNNIDGILLYGTNAVGKTSLIRAIGVSIILAQTGMYVPCSQFNYKPYTAIFSRILGNDNIFKGLSTFAVEMSELRVILKMADQNSLILGDELCSGTETESALSIFVAGLLELNKKKSSYIFATHFHEIVSYDEIEESKQLTKMHMEVSYDRELDCLVYDRKLKEGSGPRIYGLEVCKSLHLDDTFLEKAYDIRNKYYPETRGILSNKQSVYNANKLRGMCEMCNKHIGEEVHHLQHQQDANEDGFINSFHKNHKANLLTVCEECHDKLHDKNNTKKKTVKKKTTKGMKLI